LSHNQLDMNTTWFKCAKTYVQEIEIWCLHEQSLLILVLLIVLLVWLELILENGWFTWKRGNINMTLLLVTIHRFCGISTLIVDFFILCCECGCNPSFSCELR